MLTMIRNSLMSLLIFTILTGIIYPLAVTGVAQVIFPRQANGSIISKNGKAIGSKLIGQQFDDPKSFWGRLSATTPYPYNGGSSSGSNLGPNNPDLMKAVQARIDALHGADADNGAKIPVDLVTASGSGLDPHISPAAAEYQIHRVAKTRGLDDAKVRDIIANNTKGRWLGVIGESTVNVLMLNMALDEQTVTGGGK
ncbi:MAG: potassium-transporting ATPase subunit KdpC [Nitrospirota bacterium]